MSLNSEHRAAPTRRRASRGGYGNVDLPTDAGESWRNHVAEIRAWTDAQQRARDAYYRHLATALCVLCLRPRLKHTDVCGVHKAEKDRAAKAAYYLAKKEQR